MSEVISITEFKKAQIKIHKMGVNFRRYILNMPSKESKRLLISLAMQPGGEDGNFLTDGRENVMIISGWTVIILWYDDQSKNKEEDDSGWVLLATERSSVV